MENKRENYSEVKYGHSVMVYKQNNISENNGGIRDARLDLIGSEVNTLHGAGVIIAVELFPTTPVNLARYLIEIKDNSGEEILKSLFPDNRLCYFRKEFTIKK